LTIHRSVAALTPKARRGEPWRRTYRLRDLHTIRGGRVIMSEDAPMSDPETQKLWLRVNIVLAFVVIIALTIWAVSAFG
jgi:hypothetical protein